jgi:hypothetical protein
MGVSPQSLARRHWLFFVVFIFLGILFFSTLREGHDWGGDFSIYILQARNIFNHAPFDQNSYIATTYSSRDHPAAYPPLTSLILAPVYGAFGLDYRAFKIVLTGFLWISLLFYYALACRRGAHPAAAALILLLFGLSPLVATARDSIGSDSVFLFFSGAALVFLDLAYERGWNERRPFSAALAAAILVTLSYASRATGLALIAAFVLYELRPPLRIRPFGLAAIAITGISVLAYTQLVFHAGKYYGTQFVFGARIYAEHALYYLKSPAAIWSGAPAPLRFTLALATVAFALIGLSSLLRRLTITELYLALSFAVLIVYVAETPRYVLPLLPLVLMYAVLGMMWTGRRFALPPVTQKTAGAACVLIALSASAMNLRLIETGPIQEGILQPAFLNVCSFLRDRTPANSLILSWNPRVFALYTGKSSALYPPTDDARRFEAEIPRTGSTPVFLVYYHRDLDDRMLAPYLKTARAHLDPVFENGDYKVYALQ